MADIYLKKSIFNALNLIFYNYKNQFLKLSYYNFIRIEFYTLFMI